MRMTQKMVMKREVLVTKVYGLQRRYVLNVHDSEGVRYSTPKLKIMGLEMIEVINTYAIREKMKSHSDYCY